MKVTSVQYNIVTVSNNPSTNDMIFRGKPNDGITYSNCEQPGLHLVILPLAIDLYTPAY
jgi:hypothetical protein